MVFVYLISGLMALAAESAAPVASTESITATTNATSKADEALEAEYLKLLEADDAAQRQADKMIRDNEAFAANGAGLSEAKLRDRVAKVLEKVEDDYEAFLRRNPKHVRALLAFGSFLNDIGKETEAIEKWDRARLIDPNNPAAWNNLANYYGHRGPVKKAFEYYAKAIELNPKEPVYYQNFATTVFVFRKDAKEFYNIGEEQVFNKALDLFEKARALDPKNFLLATDIAQTYYGVLPPRPQEALAAWDTALTLASSQEEREGIFLHMARVKIATGDFEGARAQLNSVTNASLNVMKDRLFRSLTNRQAKAVSGETNAPEAKPSVKIEPQK